MTNRYKAQEILIWLDNELKDRKWSGKLQIELVNKIETALNNDFIAVKALKFYANRKNYDVMSGSVSRLEPRGFSGLEYLTLDFGETAREALDELKIKYDDNGSTEGPKD